MKEYVLCMTENGNHLYINRIKFCPKLSNFCNEFRYQKVPTFGTSMSYQFHLFLMTMPSKTAAQI